MIFERRYIERTEMVEEQERADRLPLRGGEQATHLKWPDVAGARL
mgnify:FL=1